MRDRPADLQSATRERSFSIAGIAVSRRHAVQSAPAVAISAHDIRKSYGPLVVLNGVSVSACKGEVISIIGGSGSGKSTFLRCLNLLEVPHRGEIAVGPERIRIGGNGGRHHRNLDGRSVERLRRRLAMVFQGFNLWDHRTVLGNVIEAPVYVHGRPRAEAVEEAESLLAKVGLSHRMNAYPAELSGGEQQRAAIARALATRPDVILMDEPTSALDPERVGEVLDVIRALAAEGRTMIIVTHEMAFARDVSNRVVFLHRGAVEEEGEPGAVFNAPRSARLGQFLEFFRSSRFT
jgi:ABC-type histidine transport system ATPase subunit